MPDPVQLALRSPSIMETDAHCIIVFAPEQCIVNYIERKQGCMVRLLFHHRDLQYQVVLILRGGCTSYLLQENACDPDCSTHIHTQCTTQGLFALTLFIIAIYMIPETKCRARKIFDIYNRHLIRFQKSCT